MTDPPAVISLEQWRHRHAELHRRGLTEPAYGGPLERHLADGDHRLRALRYDNSPAALRLWNFLLTEEDRLRAARDRGATIVGAMKDLGTVPVMAYALDDVVAFYPDGAWWIPCVMQNTAGLLREADRLGLDDSFCPVRAMAGAFVTGRHFPIPDLLVCSVGAVCDDFSAIAQRIEGMGHPIHWWEVPHRRPAETDEDGVMLPTGFRAAAAQVRHVRGELQRIVARLERLTGQTLDEARLKRGVRVANGVRHVLRTLRHTAYTADPAPLPALEMLIAEMLAIHFCSDRHEALQVLHELLDEAQRRVARGEGVSPTGAVKVFWINPVADLRVMNLLEQAGGRIAGTDYMFCHALEPIAEDVDPLEALAQAALGDPMVGSAADRAARVCREAQAFGAEAVVVSRIPGASHCAYEGGVIAAAVRDTLGLPVLEIEVQPVSDAAGAALRTRLEALMETARARRQS